MDSLKVAALEAMFKTMMGGLKCESGILAMGGRLSALRQEICRLTSTNPSLHANFGLHARRYDTHRSKNKLARV